MNNLLLQTRDTATQWLISASGRLFSLVVLIPVLLTFVYLFVFVPDRFVSVSKLSIYDASGPKITTGLLSTLGLSPTKSNNDVSMLNAYLLSPTLLLKADREMAIKEHYSSSWDFLFGLNSSSSIEDFSDFYLQHTWVGGAADSDLVDVRVEAYSPEFALQLNHFLVSEGERFINELNQNVARQEMEYASSEVRRSLERLHQTQKALTDFQGEKNLASPEAEGQSIITIVYSLETALAETKAQHSETLTYLSEDSPQAKSLRAKIQALEQQIEEQKNRLTGGQSGGENLSQLGVDYQDLLFEVELAKVVHQTAVNAFETARNRSTRTLKRLLVVSEPVLAEEAYLPNRPYTLITWILIFLTFYGIIQMSLRSIREHQD